ncbi:hypothetical protein C1645_822137 [Glomus cerebriforme]|uniref:Uncharacterized protein n=1 Tax=Glomus cerebriforme TaxID=658196 RepID=A0A397T1Y9_9GLOM|nr:hypothetical protein C1645_822137 [Glomus cerebriforme]
MDSQNSQVQFSDQQYENIDYNEQSRVVHSNDFFCHIGPYHYHINCKAIPFNTIISLLNGKMSIIQSNENEHIIFYHQEYNNQFFQITCKLVSPSFITNYLNETFHGIELQQNMIQENLVFTLYQKENLEYHLIRYLSQYLLD